MKKSLGVLRYSEFAEIFLRSFFMPSLVNLSRMQNWGWLFGLWPVLRRFYPDPEVRGKRALEQTGYFSTHPYMAPIILGVAAGLEEDMAMGRPGAKGDVLGARKFMSGPFAALGESFFWATLRPFFALTALSAGWFFPAKSWWAVPVLFLGLFNVVHVAFRGVGLAAGYRWKTDVVAFLMKLRFQSMARVASFLGLIMGFAAVTYMWSRHGGDRTTAGLIIPGVLLLLRFRIPPTLVFYAASGTGVFYKIWLGY